LLDLLGKLRPFGRQPQPGLLVQRADRPLGHLATFLSSGSAELHSVIHSHQKSIRQTRIRGLFSRHAQYV
jgi:hypothetical protein